MVEWTDRPAQATFDLHGQTVAEAGANAERFLRVQARARPGAVVRLRRWAWSGRRNEKDEVRMTKYE